MCGRFGLSLNARSLLAVFELGDEKALAERYNIAPGQSITAIRVGPTNHSPELEPMYWGFIPSWDETGKRPTINARSEKRDGRFWRKAFSRRRCLIPASWWYEWQRQDHSKQPFAIRPSNEEPFFLAAVWGWPKSLPNEHRAAGQPGCAIVTREATPEIASIHPRMPVALTVAGAQRWLAPDTPVSALGELIDRELMTGLRSWPIGRQVNDPKYDDPSLIEPACEDGAG